MPQVNDYRGERTVQMNIVDIRPSCSAPCDWGITPYHALTADRLEPQMVPLLLPTEPGWGLCGGICPSSRKDSCGDPHVPVPEDCQMVGKSYERGNASDLSGYFADVKLLELSRQHKYITIRLLPWEEKADISKSRTMQRLMRAKEE